MLRFRLRVLMLLAAVAAVLAGSGSRLAADDDGKTFRQTPAMLPVQVKGEPPPDAAPEPAPAAPRGPGSALNRGPAPAWIWGTDNNRRYLLKKEFEGGAASARLRATCDNRMRLTINGQEVAVSDTWQDPVERDVSRFVKDGKNEIVAEVANEGGPAGFIFKLVLQAPKEKPRFVVSDAAWQAAEAPAMAGATSHKWQPARKVAAMGEGAWANVFTQPGGGATASGFFQVLPGFKVERLFTVPKDRAGSWVCLTVDNKGRLIASDQENKGLFRITPPPLGSMGSEQPTVVEKLDVKMSGAQGLLYAFGSLYVSANGGPGSGLYRLRDTNGDDQFDEVVKLTSIQGGGEHGPHALRLTPDGQGILWASGNHTRPPQKLTGSRIPTNWGEDHLLPRQWDANGHARGILAPGGWIVRTDPDGKTWEMFSIGYRNEYDFALNADGELFAYDADMEWDMGMPWYRPTRAVHATSGSEFGWRSGTGKWPTYYVDSLPQLVDIGPGSPVGVEFGYGTRFPAKYQKALYLLDWTFGTIYAIHTEPEGSSYKAVKEEFLSRTPLPLTDAVVGADGALYFTTGGRGTQSELFRVTYAGPEPTAKVDYREPRNAELRELRHKIEAYHAPAADPAAAVAFVYPHLNHADHFLRYAARVALEHQKPAAWQERVLAETDPVRLIQGTVALARQGDKSLQGRLLSALDRIDWAALTEPQQLDLARAYQLVFIRMGEPAKDSAARLIGKFAALFPAKSAMLNRELVQLLVYLKSPTVVARTLELMRQPSTAAEQDAMAELLARNRGYGGSIAAMIANYPDQQKLHYAFVLRNAPGPWTPEQRKQYFTFLNEQRKKSGGASFQGFLNNMEKDAFDNATDAERLAIEAAGLRKPFVVKELPKPQGPGHEWTMPEVLALDGRLKGRDFKNGQKMFAAARCVVCHRFAGEGGATGPDLSQVAGRFSLKDLSESILEPSKVISDQYKASTITTRAGKTLTGRIVSETPAGLTVVTDPEVSTKVAEIRKADVEEVAPSPVSLMPADLLKSLNESEVLDLLAYLLSRGDPAHSMFHR